jgi:Ca2+/Na+ antiporter
LFDAEGGAKFDEHMDGGKDQAILNVFIEPEEYAKNAVDKMFKLLQHNWTKAHIGHSNWKDQFREALLVNGGDEDEDAEPPACSDYFMHFICLPWKLIFAFCPPTDYFGGWMCFFCALGFIGGVTAIVGDMTKLLGCCMGVPDSITAITIVALGTSLPDTFASKTAAIQDPYADASIVNVTGSNSVNVFLGLGIPYIMGSIYWALEGPSDEWKERYSDLINQYPDGGFVVRSGELGFSVVVFTGCAICCLSLLTFRRLKYGAELGGPRVAKTASSVVLFLLWSLYIGLNCWNGLRNKR